MNAIDGASLRTGGPKLGVGLMYPCPGIVERIGRDWDWVWIDGQHGQFGYQDILAAVRACEFAGCASLVRVASHESGAIGLALDMGATGVIVPLVNTARQARRLVTAAKFPPLGERSFGGRRPVDLHGRQYAVKANSSTLLVVQIETPEALRNAEQIAAMPGVDALFLGPDDIMLRLGLDMNAARPRQDVEMDLVTVAAACRRHGKLAVTVGGSPESLALSLAHGYDLIVAGADSGFLAAGSKVAARKGRELIENRGDLAKQAAASGVY